MRHRIVTLALSVVFVAAGLVATPATAAENRPQDYVGLVNPWIEADRARWFFFQSASNPFGMIKLRPETASGYRTTENQVHGFGHLHEWQMGGIEVMPTTGNDVPKTEGRTAWQSHVEHDETEIAQPGYHKLHLDRYDITTELTVTDRVGLHRYTYGAAGPSEILINLGGNQGESGMRDAEVTRVGDRAIEGYVDQYGNWGYDKHDARLFFSVQFDRPFSSMRGWADGNLVSDGAPVDKVAGDNAGAFARFDQLAAGDVVQMKVGLSLTGVDGARRNIRAELPGWDFDRTKRASQDRWNEMLGRIDVRGGTAQQQEKFYTDLFHVLCGRGMISDADGRYMDDTWNHGTVKQIPRGRDGKPEFAMYNYDALWLTQWNVNSVLGLAYPEILNSFVRSQLQMYADGGLLPRGPAAGNDTLIMTGSPVTSFITGAWNKGVRDFDKNLAYDAMLDAHSVGGLITKGMMEYEGWSDTGGSRDYLDLGYVPYRPFSGLNGGAGQTLEYAHQDWALAGLAGQLHKRGINATQYAKAEVSSQANGTSASAARAIDGRPIRSSTGAVNEVEWVSKENKPSITLRWDSPRTIKKVVLSDRAATTSNAHAGVLTFSDGTKVPVSGIPADGTPKPVAVSPRSKVSWVKFAVTVGEGNDVGLNEIEAWDDTDVSKYLLDRSRNWRNLYDAETRFIRPRLRTGEWLQTFNPLSGDNFVEANSWQATWFTTHDVMGLANLMGGEDAYADKLNYAFVRSEPSNFIGRYGEGYVSYGNQPGLPVAHLFNYVGKPWLSQYWVRQVKEKTYGSTGTMDGYGHHDEDQGQMGAMSALMAIGLFEVTGGGLDRPIYDITSPVFDEITIKLNQEYYRGDEFRIVTHNNSAENLYIQGARLDGRQLDNAWFYHDQFADGGTLELWMGDKPNTQWGVKDLPHSESPSAGKKPVFANSISIDGPALVEEPFGTASYSAEVAPANTTLPRVFWSVTEPDGSPTDKATIDNDGRLEINHREGSVVVTARNADSGPAVVQRKTVKLDLDPALLRGNASRWPGVTAAASSEYSNGYLAERVFDGTTHSADSGDWASAGEQNPSIQLNWTKPIQADRITLYDRPGVDDAHGGTLTFSDGSTVKVSDIPTNGDEATVRFGMKTFDWVKFQVEGGTGPNVGLSELEVYAVPSVPQPPRRVYATQSGSSATLAWEPPAFDGGTPVLEYIATATANGTVVGTKTVDGATRTVTFDGLAEGVDHAFTVAARNFAGTGAPQGEAVPATAVAVTGPDTITVPDSTTPYDAVFTPADATDQGVTWAVTEPDGSYTTKATISSSGQLRVNSRTGEVKVTATHTENGRTLTGSKTVRIDLDLSQVRENAARWAGTVATASSVYSDSYVAGRVRDGLASGSGEWASNGEQNPWVQLTWASPVQADRVALYDRPGVDDAKGGTLTFSDGSTIEVTGIPANGSAKEVRFDLKTFTSVRFQVAGGTGPNVGLREFEVYAKPRTS